MRLLAGLLCGLALAAGPADRTVARWTLLEGGRVGIAGRVYNDIAELPEGDFDVQMVDWVAVNAVPEDLERMTGLRQLRELRLPGPLWNRNADGGKDLSKQLQFLAPVATLEKLTFSDHFLDRIRFRDAGLDAISPLRGLRELAIRQAEVKGPGLRHFVNLESLDVTLCPLADFAAIAGMTRLRRLWAGDTFVTSLEPLAALSALEDLDLHGTAVRDEAITHLARLHKLRRLDLQGTAITDAAVDTLAQLTALESLNLYRTQISNAGLARLARLTRLRDIDVRYTRITASGYEALRAALPRARIQFAGGAGRALSKAIPPSGSDAASLQAWIRKIGGFVEPAKGRVSLRGVPLNEAALTALARIPGLRALDLEATEIGDGAMPGLAEIATLEELSLNSTQVSDTGLSALGALPRLRKLSVDNTYVEGAAFARWPEQVPLEELSLLGAPVGDAAMPAIARFARLRKLILAESDVTAAGLASLTKLPLEYLDLAAADINDDTPLDRFPRLRWLSLRDTRISDLTLARKLPALHSLEYLDLARARVSNAGLERIAGLTTLRTLDLSYAELDDAGLTKLAPLRNLESLNLDSTHVTDASVPTLAGLARLRHLNLYHSLFTAQGLTQLRKSLPATQVIWDLEAGMPHRRRA